MLVTSIFSFSHNVFYPSQNKFVFLATFDLLSANAFKLDLCKNLLFAVLWYQVQFVCEDSEIIGKTRNFHLSAFSSFPTKLSNAFSVAGVKTHQFFNLDKG